MGASFSAFYARPNELYNRCLCIMKSLFCLNWCVDLKHYYKTTLRYSGHVSMTKIYVLHFPYILEIESLKVKRSFYRNINEFAMTTLACFSTNQPVRSVISIKYILLLFSRKVQINVFLTNINYRFAIIIIFSEKTKTSYFTFLFCFVWFCFIFLFS